MTGKLHADGVGAGVHLRELCVTAPLASIYSKLSGFPRAQTPAGTISQVITPMWEQWLFLNHWGLGYHFQMEEAVACQR